MDLSLGLIGGLGVGASVHYYERLARAYEERKTPMRLLMAHADIHQAARYAQAGDRAGMAEYLCGLIEQLKRGGAEVAAIPAVTPHMCWRELEAISPLPLVSILDAVAAEVQSAGYRRVALFGTRYTIASGFFGALDGVQVVTPIPEEIEAIHAAYFQMATEGRGTREQHRELTAIAQTLRARDGVEAILLAGTDLALVFQDDNTPFPYVDCSAAHIRAILARLHGAD
jgi:aspartate racemase